MPESHELEQPPIELTPEERQVLDIATNYLNSSQPEVGLQIVKQIVEKTGCQIELISAGSDHDRGRLARKTYYPNGIIELMNVRGVDTPTSQLRELVHEFLYLQLYKLAMPDINDKDNPSLREKASRKFASGLKSRLQAEIKLTEDTCEDGDEKERRLVDLRYLLEKCEDQVYTLKNSKKFIQDH
jgi:hypothetical protein